MKKFFYFILFLFFFCPNFVLALDTSVAGNNFLSNAFQNFSGTLIYGGQVNVSSEFSFNAIRGYFGTASSTGNCGIYLNILDSSCHVIATSSTIYPLFNSLQPHYELMTFSVATSTFQPGVYNIKYKSANCPLSNLLYVSYVSSDVINNQCAIDNTCSCATGGNRDIPLSFWLLDNFGDQINNYYTSSSSSTSSMNIATTSQPATSTDIGEIISYTDGTYTHYQIPFLLFRFMEIILAFCIITAALLIFFKQKK